MSLENATGPALQGLVVGDSFGDEADEYPVFVNWPLQVNCTAGDGIVNEMEPAFTTTLANRPADSHFVIIQGGVNDLNDNYDEDDISAAITSMTNEASALGLEVIVVGISPFGNNGGWNATKQTRLDAYNAWLSANAESVGFTYVDIYSVLEDDVTADALEADYDPGDGLHPNEAGSRVLAAQIDAALDSLNLYAEVQGVNIDCWRGAVEPAETGASGNEVKAWRGAVEPAYVAPSPPSPSPGGKKGRSSSKRAKPKKGPMRLRILLRDGEQLKIK